MEIITWSIIVIAIAFMRVKIIKLMIIVMAVLFAAVVATGKSKDSSFATKINGETSYFVVIVEAKALHAIVVVTTKLVKLIQ